MNYMLILLNIKISRKNRSLQEKLSWEKKKSKIAKRIEHLYVNKKHRRKL